MELGNSRSANNAVGAHVATCTSILLGLSEYLLRINLR